MNRILILIFLVILPAILHAAPIRTKSWHYYKKINGWSTSKVYSESVAILELDSQVSKKRSDHDLRILLGKRELPYFTRYKSMETLKSQKLPVEIIFEKTKKNYNTILIKLPLTPVNHSLQRLEFQLPYSYEGSISMSYGNDPDHMIYGSHQRLFRYSNGDQRRYIILPGLKNKKYLRLHYKIKKNLRPAFLHIISDKKNLDYELSAQDGKFTINEGENNTQIISIPNNNHRPVYRLEMQFEQNRYSREIEVYKYDTNSREFVLEYRDQIESSNQKNNIQMISFNRTVFNAIRIIIKNKDDEPLKPKFIKIFAPREEIVLNLPDVTTLDESFMNKPLLLYYGNEYAPRPEYDFNTTWKKTSRDKMLALYLGPQIQNPEFAWSLIEPPVSIYFIRVLFFLGVLFTSWPAWKVFQNLPDKNKGK